MLDWLKNIRKAANLSTYKASKGIGISQSHYSSIENGSRGVTVTNAKKIASFFGFDWTKFFDTEGVPNGNNDAKQ